MAAPLPQDEAIHAVLTVRGKTGAALALVPLHMENSAEVKDAFLAHMTAAQREQILHVCTDDPSQLLFSQLRSVCTNIKCNYNI
jgi:hypothetical protein